SKLSSTADQLTTFHALFGGTAAGNPVVRAARDAIARYMQQLGIDQRFLPQLLTYAWIEKAITYAEAQQEYRPADLDSRDGNRSVAYIGILAEQLDQLFAETSPRRLCAS